MRKNYVTMLLCGIVSLAVSACFLAETNRSLGGTVESVETEESGETDESDKTGGATTAGVYLEPVYRSHGPSYWGDAAYSEFLCNIPEEYQEEYEVQQIASDIRKALLLRCEEMTANVKEVLLYDFETGEAESLVGDLLAQYIVHTVEMSADMEGILLNTLDGAVYCYDGKVVELNDYCECDEESRTVGTLYRDGVRIMVRTYDAAIGDNGGYRYTFYWYSKETENASYLFRVEDVNSNSENRDHRFKMYGDQYATSVEQGELIVWNMVSGQYVTTSIPEADINSIVSVDSEHLLVLTEDGLMKLVGKASGSVTTMYEEPIDMRGAFWGTIEFVSDDEIYLELRKEDDVYEYYLLNLK